MREAGRGGVGRRDSSCGAQPGLTGQRVLVAAIALAAVCGSPYVAFGAIIEGEESRVTIAGCRAPLLGAH